MGKLTAKRTNHYPVEISGSWYHFGRSRNRILNNGRISGQPEPDIRYIPSSHVFIAYLCFQAAFVSVANSVVIFCLRSPSYVRYDWFFTAFSHSLQ